MTSRSDVEQLSPHRLNRSVLARQHLLDRVETPITTLVESIGGLQTQYAPSGYVALWIRLRQFQRGDLTGALESRQLIQGTLMRATIHTVTAADYWPLVAGVRRARREWFDGATREMRGDVDMNRVADEVRKVLADGPLKMKDLLARLSEAGYKQVHGNWLHVWVDLVRVPPSGTWEKRRADLIGLAEDWLPPEREYTEDEGFELLIRRYLGGFGPASLRDLNLWAGVPSEWLKPVVERMELRTFRDAAGKILLDLPGAPLPD